jgi:hypothetical protein
MTYAMAARALSTHNSAVYGIGNHAIPQSVL